MKPKSIGLFQNPSRPEKNFFTYCLHLVETIYKTMKKVEVGLQMKYKILHSFIQILLSLIYNISLE